MITKTVEELIDGSVDNMSQEEIDEEMRFLKATAKELGVDKNDIDNIAVIIDEDYEMELDKMENPYVLDEKNGLRFVFVKDEEIAEQEINAQQERNAEYER